MNQFQALGRSGVTEPTELLEKFPVPPFCKQVTMKTDEVYARCPVTGQPDFYAVTVTYDPSEWCIESKSFKLYVQSFANGDGIFCEQLADQIAYHVMESIAPKFVQVNVEQKPRGGVGIISTSIITTEDV